MIRLDDIIDFNPSERLKKGQIYPFMEMSELPTRSRDATVRQRKELKSGGSKFKDGDALFARITPCLENGKGGLVTGLGDGVAFGSTEFIVMRSKPGLPTGLAYYISRDPAFRAFAKKRMKGTSGRQRVSWQALADYEVSEKLPARAGGIVATLQALDDKIELNRRMNATLEAQARAVFRDWFIDFGPTRAKLTSQAPYLPRDLWALFPDKLGDDGLPVGWQQSEIGKEIETVGGSTPSTKVDDYWHGSIHWATPKDLSNLNAPVIGDTSRTITREGLAKISSGLLPAGVLLMSSRAPVGYLAITTVPIAINQGFIAMKPNAHFSNLYIWLWCSEHMDRIKGNANGSTFQEISKKNFRPLPFIVPKTKILEAFEKRARPIFDQIVGLTEESEKLAETRDYLLPRLMCGEVEVKIAR